MDASATRISLDDIVKRLVKETCISEWQALELIQFLGLNWCSLVREAKILARIRPHGRKFAH